MDVRSSESEERIRRLENNIRVLCQNIENSNSILTMKKKATTTAVSEDDVYDERTIDERHTELLQTTSNLNPQHHFSTQGEYERAKDTKAELLRKEMETWHVQQMSQSPTGGNKDGGGEEEEEEVVLSGGFIILFFDFILLMMNIFLLYPLFNCTV